MPMFFFHLRAPEGLERDEIGLDCPDFEAAYLEAYGSIPELTADLIRRGRNPMECAFEIEDAEGKLLITLPFMERVQQKPNRPSQRHVEAMRAATQLERAYGLAEAVREQVQALHREMQASREWLASTRTMIPF